MQGLLAGLTGMTLRHVVMIAIGSLLIWLAIRKGYEPMLLLPIGFGAILANVPHSAAVAPGGILDILYEAGIVTEMFPALVFVAVGAMMDFSPLLQNPVLIVFGAMAQFGVFFTLVAAAAVGFDLKEAASIGVIGTADGPTSIYVASHFAPHLLAPVSVAAYSYMSLVPIIQPPVIRLLTTRAERCIVMPYRREDVSRTALILFPIVVTVIAGLVAPMGLPLIGMLMFGNLLRECGVVARLSRAAQEELANLVTLLLGITIGSSMRAEAFLAPSTLLVLFMGLVAFAADTAGGVLFAKLLNVFLGKKLNPMVGAAGISAFPMSSRVITHMALAENHQNYGILMQAAGANTAGQVASVMAGALILALVR